MALVLVVGVVVPSVSWGQATKGKKALTGPVEIEEITVTAQKREENIQEIPISVTAVTAATLAEKGSASVSDLTQSVPNLNVVQNNVGYSVFQMQMRGTANGEISLAQNPTVGLYVDGAIISKAIGANLDLEDLDRVEVLRGPQGTLYGKNTTGGAINLITRKPTEERSLTVATEVGNYDAFKGRLTVNVPLIGKNGFFQSNAIGTLSLRENAVYRSHDGFSRNQSPTAVQATGPGELQDLNRVFNMTALRWQPTKDITVDYSFEYHRYRESPPATQLSYVYPGSPVDGGPVDLRPYVRKNRVDAIGINTLKRSYDLNKEDRFNDDGNHRMHTLTGTWDLGQVGPLGAVTLKSISAYRSLTADNNTDGDGSPLHLADFHLHNNIDNWSTELQWVGVAPRVHYVLGAYYYGEHTTEESQQVFFGGAYNFFFRNTGKDSAYAPYGQITVTPPILSDKLSITGGLRYTGENVHMHRDYRCINISAGSLNVCNIGIPGLEDFNVSTGKGFQGTDGLTPMGDISYQWTDELMTYFRVSRGFNSGTPNGRASDARLFGITNPEKLWSYEAGFKSQWFDNRLRFNADGFFSQYTDQVISVFRASQTGGAVTSVENAGESEFWGSEVEAAAIPLRGLEVTGSYSYLSAKYTKWESQKFDAQGRPVFDAQGNPVLENVANQRVVALAPENSFSLGLTYTAPPTSTGTFSAHIDLFWQDSFDFTALPFLPDHAWSHEVTNGRLQFVDIPLQKGSLDVAVFGRNLFDEKYRASGVDFSSTFGWAINGYGDRRTFGLGLSYHFSASESVPAPPAPVAQAAPPPPPVKKKIVLRSVHFDFDKATLKAEAKPILDEAVQVLKHEGSVDIIVEGHTDSVGTEQYNLGLSRRRAETVRSYLVRYGVAPSRITADGLGESKPVASNDTADGRAQNRRVELHVK